MARKLGPKHKLCRRVGEKLCSTVKCPVTRRNYPPGVHGPKGGQKRTEYGTQLLEKQKAKYIYGILERQFKRYYTNAVRKTGDTSVYLAQYLERRLDNVVYRLGLTKTRNAARQAIVHGHVLVNDHRLDRPSYAVTTDDIIRFVNLKEVEKREVPAWLSLDKEGQFGKVVGAPTVEKLPERLNMRLIIELYSR
ncbi:MAG: 30S ribosomal protein S4 [bacterium]|nr:30S ribosomal protein S4 [bacterium]MDO8581595.1 30S ribosomal protein S4 [bacterium]